MISIRGHQSERNAKRGKNVFYDQYGDYDKDFAIKLANHIVLKPRTI